jgi:hypothetical protein
MFRHYLGPSCTWNCHELDAKRDLMSTLMKGRDLEYPTMIAAMRQALAAITDRDRDKTVSTLLLLGTNYISFILLCLTAFSQQIPVVMYRYDGTLLLTTAKNQQQWMGHGLSFTMNFLEGNGGLWWAQINTLFDPALVFAQWVANDEFVPVVAFTVYAAEFFLTTNLLGFCLGLRTPIVLAGAWLGSLMAFPFFVPTLATDVLWGNPHALTAISLLSVMVWVLMHVGQGRTVFLATLGLLLIGSYIGFEFAGAAIQVIPACIVFAVAAVWSSSSAGERRTKITILLIVAAALTILFGRFLVGLYIDTKGSFFPHEMLARPLSFENISHLLAPDGRIMSRVGWLFALAGALAAAALAATRALRVFAIGYLIIAFFIALAVALISLFIGDWWGPNPAYVDIYCFSLCSLLAASFAAILLQFTRRSILENTSGAMARFVARTPSISNQGLIALAIVPWVSLAWARPPYADQNILNGNPWRWPPRASTVSDFLKREIGLVNGATFRGRVVNVAGATFLKSWIFAPFVSQHSYDQIPLVYLGNDHRLYGLWYFGIPTLIENNHFSSPFFHLVTTRLLNNDPVFSVHAQTALTKFDPRVLAALGVRFVLTDTMLDVNEPLRLQVDTGPSRSQFLYELARPNLGNYSPTRIHLVADATAAIKLMASSQFDFAKELVLVEKIGDADWRPALKSELKAYRDHLEINAAASGRSIIVLPVEFSHCLEFRLQSDASDPIEIRRANLEQTAIAFSKSVRGSIALRYGPFTNAGCRLSDYRDAIQLNLSAVPSSSAGWTDPEKELRSELPQ